MMITAKKRIYVVMHRPSSILEGNGIVKRDGIDRSVGKTTQAVAYASLLSLRKVSPRMRELSFGTGFFVHFKAEVRPYILISATEKYTQKELKSQRKPV